MHGRIRRLAAVSSIALGGLWWLSLDVDGAGTGVHIALAAGWVLMPSVLWASLFAARLRYALALPSSLVSLAVLRLAFLASR
jgi:hypothetical protein